MDTPTTPKELSDTQLAPLVAWAHSNRGAIGRIAERMAKKSGQAVNRHMVGRWLAQEPDKRIQPSHGYALLMADVVAELQDEDRQLDAERRRTEPAHA
jgi:hypothetical protein